MGVILGIPSANGGTSNRIDPAKAREGEHHAPVPCHMNKNLFSFLFQQLERELSSMAPLIQARQEARRVMALLKGGLVF